MRSILLMLLVSLGLVMGVACEKKNQAPSGGKSSGKKKKKGGDDVGECSSDDDEEELELVGGVTYDAIAAMMEDKCTSCHVGNVVSNEDALAYDCEDENAEKPGAVDLTTYSQVKVFAQQIIKHMTSDDPNCRMPAAGPTWSDSEIADFEAWVSDGMPKGATRGDEDEEDDEEESCSSESTGDSDDGGDDDATDDGADATDPKTLDETVINPPMLKTCNEMGKAYMRETFKCHEKIQVDDTCDEKWVEQALGADGLATLNNFKGQGYILDQCGKYGDEIVVLMYCTAAVPGGPCVPKEELESNVSIKTACFQTFQRKGDCKYDEI